METHPPLAPVAPPPPPLPSNYNPVTVHDTVGVVLLGIITLTLLVAFIRAEAGHRAALAQLAGAR